MISIFRVRTKRWEQGAWFTEGLKRLGSHSYSAMHKRSDYLLETQGPSDATRHAVNGTCTAAAVAFPVFFVGQNPFTICPKTAERDDFSLTLSLSAADEQASSW